jgi:hypothetical protein
MDFQIARDDLHRTRVVDTETPELEAGQALLTVDTFGLTSNNVTYAKFGDAMSYWNFFPAQDGWGRMPVWGFAEVTASEHDDVAAGTRVYGYLPPSSHLVIAPGRVGGPGFTDSSAHRARLPAPYNFYARTDSDPGYDAEREDQQMLLRPLFATAFLLDDFLDEAEAFGAGAVVLSSASSKTASALAFLLSQRGGFDVVGMTSPRSAEFVGGLGVYDTVVAYDDIESLPADPAIYVDMAGDASVREAVHRHLGDALKHDAVVGATHHEQMGDLPDDLPGPRPTLFFAPDRASKRAADWGPGGIDQRLADAWRPYVEWTTGWLKVEHDSGPEAIERVYLDVLDGRIDPAAAHVLSPSA